MYIAVTGSRNNKDVYIYQSFRKENGKSSSRIYKKLGKYNTLLEQFDGNVDRLMAWAKEQAAKETEQNHLIIYQSAQYAQKKSLCLITRKLYLRT